MAEHRPFRVMLVEDHADFRGAMATLLDRQPDLAVVDQAGSLEEARRHVASVGFEVAVIDMGLSDGDGIDLIRELRESRLGVAVLILSASLDAANLPRVREAGADEVLDKFAPPEEVVDTIRRFGTG